MSYFKVSTAQDELPLYVWADNTAHAIRQVNEVVGENTVNGRTRYQAIAIDKAPDAGIWVIGEPPELETKRNAEEEF
jgi:hypothetical protein